MDIKDITQNKDKNILNKSLRIYFIHIVLIVYLEWTF